MPTIDRPETHNKTFSKYQVFMIAILAILQFTVILDFMVLSPLGALLMEQLQITTSQFGLVVSAYAFSAGASGLLAAGFADKFDRKKLLLFFYSGFIVGTLLCGIAPDYRFLLVARVVTGLFGGVLSSVSYAIIADLFALELRGRVMGFVQMAFAASQVLGIPIGLVLANAYGWHASFLLIVGVSLVVGLLIVRFVKPLTTHLRQGAPASAFRHLTGTLARPRYLMAFSATTLLATGGYLLMPFGSAFAIHNLGVTQYDLPLLFGITGVFSIGFGPLIGKLSDRIGKYRVFVIGSVFTSLLVVVYNNLGVTPLWAVVALNVAIFAGVTARMIPASALMTAIPRLQDRGAFMSINSSVQQVSGGIGSAVAGLIVVQQGNQPIEHYDTLGYVFAGAMAVVVVLMYFVNRMVVSGETGDTRQETGTQH